MPPTDQKAQKDARDKLLDQLVSDTNDWEAAQTKALQARVASSKRILKGRTGADRLTQTIATQSAALLAEEISTFLVGSPA